MALTKHTWLYSDLLCAFKGKQAGSWSISTKCIHKPFTCCLLDNSSVFTAELQASLLALKRVYCSEEKSFLILSDSLSSLQAIYKV